MASQPTTTANTTDSPGRRLYNGSCHCGYTRYRCLLTFPPPAVHVTVNASITTRMRKCNCTSCHKTNFFHVRPQSSPDDFVLLAPTNPFDDPADGGLADYQCFAKFTHWFFCPKCGVRCFTFGGESELAEIDLGEWSGGEKEGKLTKVWRVKKEGWKEGDTSYLSINATSLDARQEGLDLREWHDKGWIVYLDMLDEEKENEMAPFEGGMY
ncbi:hypothetical protein BU16DRAFT_569191 [Lophium mytilinum]|uniref:CENP-V/GFA domain-containing protein n=1 Tax=Lophium mytilinum TaxID=390894 RepID=A0A6A6RHT7_9PEZI|nr:hypothetical protein BU16DRAFT_569191 [Lophium mytilinum]